MLNVLDHSVVNHLDNRVLTRLRSLSLTHTQQHGVQPRNVTLLPLPHQTHTEQNKACTGVTKQPNENARVSGHSSQLEMARYGVNNLRVCKARVLGHFTPKLKWREVCLAISGSHLKLPKHPCLNLGASPHFLPPVLIATRRHFQVCVLSANACFIQAERVLAHDAIFAKVCTAASSDPSILVRRSQLQSPGRHGEEAL